MRMFRIGDRVRTRGGSNEMRVVDVRVGRAPWDEEAVVVCATGRRVVEEIYYGEPECFPTTPLVDEKIDFRESQLEFVDPSDRERRLKEMEDLKRKRMEWTIAKLKADGRRRGCPNCRTEIEWGLTKCPQCKRELSPLEGLRGPSPGEMELYWARLDAFKRDPERYTFPPDDPQEMFERMLRKGRSMDDTRQYKLQGIQWWAWTLLGLFFRLVVGFIWGVVRLAGTFIRRFG